MERRGTQTTSTIKINQSIKIIQSSRMLTVTKNYAEKNLSASALRHADSQDSQYYYFAWGTKSYIVVFELPSIFNVTFPEVMRYMINYCMPYMQENNLTESVFYHKFLENLDKKIK